ncbi:MAG: hypothetical protein ACKVJQ_10010 [Alphaproteobacteria bacterium]|jgi:hypothetical protein
MTSKSFLTLLILTITITAAAFWVTISSDSGTGIRGDGRILFPDLATQVNDVRRIKITRASGTSTLIATTTLDGTKDGKVNWALKELYNYPAPLISVRAVAAGMASIAVIEAKTNRAAKYLKIRVEDPAQHKGNKNSHASRIELFNAKDEKISDLIVGLEKPTLSGTGQLFVRKPGDDRAWLARGKVFIPEKREGWVNQMIVEVDLPRVRETILALPGEKPLRIFKKAESDQDFTLEGMAKTRELKELFGAEDIARAIQNLAFVEVRPQTELGFDFSQAPRTRYVTYDGLIIENWVASVGKKHWAAFRARANPTPEKGDKVDAAKRDKEILKINTVTKGWAYTINPFETKNLLKTMKSMTQPKPGSTPVTAPAKK